MQFYVVYSIAQSRARVIVVLSPGGSPPVPRSGEAVATMDTEAFFTASGGLGEVPDLPRINAAIARTTGRPVLDDRHHVVDDAGLIRRTVLHDPAVDGELDLPAGYQLVPHHQIEETVERLRADQFVKKTSRNVTR